MSTQPPLQWVPGALSPGVKRPGLEVDNSPPTSAEVKKMWIYTSTPPYVLLNDVQGGAGSIYWENQLVKLAQLYVVNVHCWSINDVFKCIHLIQITK
jgi:hypothetical protein